MYLLYGLLETKDAQGFLAPLLPRVARACAVQIPGAAASLSATDAAAAASVLGRDDVTTADSLQAGLKSFADAPPGLVLVCGSLYLAGAFLAENQGLAPTENRKAV